ncbi:MAG: ribosome recycling factor [Limnobacter sp.]|nr:ribosome recycling factor [Limnobacter sp.]
MSVAEVRQAAEQKMQKSLEAMKTSFQKIRTGRAHAGLLDHIHVDYYGSSVPLSQVANVTVQDARTLAVQPWEKKMVQVVDKAIRESDLGLNPATSGDLIRVPMPPLSEERRREMTKIARADAEHAKVAVRNLRREANEQFKKLLKEKAISEDEERRSQDEMQKLTDRFVAEIDKLLAAKEQEIMTV